MAFAPADAPQQQPELTTGDPNGARHHDKLQDDTTMTALQTASVLLVTASLCLASASATAVLPHQATNTGYPVRNPKPPAVLHVSHDRDMQTPGNVSWTMSVGSRHRAIH